MKKLLRILTISTLTASIPPPSLANAPLTRVKRDVSTLTSNSNNESILIKINGIDVKNNCIIKDENNNFYFGTNSGVYVLKKGTKTPTKIDGINTKVLSISVNKSNTFYFGTDSGAFVLKHGETTPKPIKSVSGNIYSIAVDKSDNVYIATVGNGLYKLPAGSTTPTKINGINDWLNFIFVDNLNNIFVGTTGGLYKLPAGSTTPTKINDVNTLVSIFDNKNNILFGTSAGIYKLPAGSNTLTKIKGVNNIIRLLAVDINNNIYLSTREDGNDIFILNYDNNISKKIVSTSNWINAIFIINNNELYFGSNDGTYVFQSVLSWLKQQSQFTLMDRTKNMMWLRDNQLVANGQVKVKIANTDIDTVKVNGAIMPSPDKNWDFDLPVDSTTVENKDYQIEMAFKVDRKSYAGQIIVSSLLAQPSINVQKNTSPLGNVASYVYQVPTNDKVGDVILTSDLYYSDTEVKVSLNQPTGSTVQSGVVYGLNDKWQKNGQKLDIAGDVSLNATMLNSYQGRFLVETKDSAGNSSFYYIALNKDNLTPNFWDTDQGQQFYARASLNGYNESIKKLNAIELNKIINESKNWQQLASDSQFAAAVAEWFKTSGKLSSKEPLTKEQVVAQLKTQIPSTIIIPGVNTSNYDVNKVSFELNQSEFNLNDKANITVKYNNETSEQFTLQIKDSNAPDNNKKTGLGIWAIFGIVIGSLLGVFILGWLFKRFVVDPFILKPIRDKKQKARRIRKDKALAEIQAEEEAEKNASEQVQENRELDDEQNNKGGEE